MQNILEIIIYIHTSDLMKACKEGNTEKVIELLNKNPPISMMNTYLEVAVDNEEE